ncbi:MAG: SdrD B-like domain-containing protein, partial [Chitinophagales bacterium]
LPAGNYTVTVGDGPEGTTLTTAGSFNVSLDEGEVDLTSDFGFEPASELGSIAGVVFEDTNGNGVQDAGEPGIEGVIVLLEPANGPNIIATTDGNGVYIFTDLPVDTYTVSVTNPPVGMNPTTSTGQTVDLGPGENVTDVNFGFQPELGSIGDFVFMDLNSNGEADGFDFGIEGVTVTLTLSDGSTVTTTTDESGFYIFEDLPAGGYIVTVGDGPDDTELTTTGNYGVDLENGENFEDADFGFGIGGGGGGQEICTPEYTLCAEPVSPVEICPEFPCLDSSWELQSATTTYNCSLSIIDNCLRYTALPLFVGSDTIEIVACDAFQCDTAYVFITVSENCAQSVNTAPIAEDDLTITEEDTTVKIPVLTNDSDPDGDEFSITSFTQPENGTVVLSEGILIYTPNPDFVGIETFTYQICDPEGLCDVATVVIEVRPGPCSNELFFCTEPLIPLEICPEFCGLQGSEDVVITNAHTTYNCSLQLGDDGKCLQYTALPLFAGEETVTIIGCNGDGICDTVIVKIQVTGCDDLGDGGIAEIGEDSEDNGDTTVTPVGVPTIDTDTPMDDNDGGTGGDEDSGSGKSAQPSADMIGLDETKLIINSLIPVPAIDFINVTFTSQDGDATISIYDLTGKLLDQIPHRTVNGMNMKRIDIIPYPTGVYVITIEVNNQMISSKFLKKGN